MDLELSDEQIALRDTVRRLVGDRAPLSPYVRTMFDDPRGFTDEVWKELAALGVTGLLVPEKDGGSGLTMVEMGIVLEELGRAVHPGPLITSAVGAVRALIRLGDIEPAILPGLADGSVIGTLALAEREHPRRWELSETTADVVDGSYVLSGEKTDVLDAMSAHVFLVVASLTGDDGRPGLFLVDKHAPGVAVEPDASIDGTRKRGVLTLSRTPAVLLGNPGMDELRPIVDDLFVALGSDALGAATRCLELAVEYAKVREQFGRPIGSFQGVQQLCVDIYRAVEMTRGAVMYAQWAADECTAEEYHHAATLVKVAGTRLVSAAENAIQVFGGIGFTWEHDLHLFYKRLLSFDAFLGTAGEHAAEVGRAYVERVLAPQ